MPDGKGAFYLRNKIYYFLEFFKIANFINIEYF